MEDLGHTYVYNERFIYIHIYTYMYEYICMYIRMYTHIHIHIKLRAEAYDAVGLRPHTPVA